MQQPAIVDSHLTPTTGAHVWPQVPAGHFSAEGTDETEVPVTILPPGMAVHWQGFASMGI